MRRILWAGAVSLCLVALPASAENLCVIGWNVESGDSDLQTIAQTIKANKDCHLFGLSEVESPGFADDLDQVLDTETGVNWHSIVGTTGLGRSGEVDDRLAILYNPVKLIAIDAQELTAIQAERGRAPLVVTFELRQSGARFMFMVNHLYRGNNADNRFKRDNQSESLNRWAKNVALPLIAVGDYNYDWKIQSGDHDSGYDKLTENGVYRWVRPSTLVGTQCSEGVTTPRSVLDFVFAAGGAQSWTGTSEILERQAAYCPDNASRSDHRPVRATFVIP